MTVLKKVDKELPDVAVASSGPRFTTDGEILPYSILGSVSDYKQATAATGYTVCATCFISAHLLFVCESVIVKPRAPRVL